MAKPSLKQLQKRMLERLKLQKRNANNWGNSIAITPSTSQDIKDWGEIRHGNRGYKPFNKMKITGRA